MSGPYYQPPRLPVDRWFSSEGAVGTAASILAGLVGFLSVLLAVADWRSYRAVKAYVDGPVRDPDSIDRADLAALLLWAGYPFVVIAALVVFIVWLWRVRWNAELFCEAKHRHSRGWVAGAWVCPVVNLWFPKQIVDDVIAASERDTPPRTERLAVRSSPLVWAWWLTLLAGAVFQLAAGRGLAGRLSVDGRLLTAGLATVAALCTCAAAALTVQLIGRVNQLQTARTWTPWWAATTAPPVHSPTSGMPQYGPPGYRGRLGHSTSINGHGQ